MTATKAIRDRLLAMVEDDMTVVTGTVKTTMPRLTGGVTQFEGYIFKAYCRTANPSTASGGRLINEAHQWVIEVHSPAVGIGWDGVKEDAMYDYYDKLVQLFANNTVLRLADDTKLNEVTEARLGNGTFTWGDATLDGTNLRYKLSIPLNFTKRTPCESS